MNRRQLEHLIRAAGRIADVDEVLVIGSQTILGQHPEGLPPEAVRSMEGDIALLDDRSALVERIRQMEQVEPAVKNAALRAAEVLATSGP